MRGRMYAGRMIKGIKISFKVNNPEIFIEGSQRMDITGLSYTIHSSSNVNQQYHINLTKSRDMSFHV